MIVAIIVFIVAIIVFIVAIIVFIVVVIVSTVHIWRDSDRRNGANAYRWRLYRRRLHGSN
jgi:hypothetical protein